MDLHTWSTCHDLLKEFWELAISKVRSDREYEMEVSIKLAAVTTSSDCFAFKIISSGNEGLQETLREMMSPNASDPIAKLSNIKTDCMFRNDAARRKREEKFEEMFWRFYDLKRRGAVPVEHLFYSKKDRLEICRKFFVREDRNLFRMPFSAYLKIRNHGSFQAEFDIQHKINVYLICKGNPRRFVTLLSLAQKRSRVGGRRMQLKWPTSFEHGLSVNDCISVKVKFRPQLEVVKLSVYIDKI